jgi:hypothetical protein
MKKVQTTALRARQFRLIFSALLVLIVSQFNGRANYNAGPVIKPLPQTPAFITLWGYTDLHTSLKPVTNNKVKTFDDFTVTINNYYGHDVDVWLYNNALDTFWYLNVHPYQTDVNLTIPEGTYDINLWPNDQDGYNHYLVGCGNYGAGWGSYVFWGKYLGASCNLILIDY